MAKHAAPAPFPTIVDRLTEIIDELDDIEQCADDIGWRAVQHKAEEALGRLTNALVAAQQYESGDREPAS